LTVRTGRAFGPGLFVFEPAFDSTERRSSRSVRHVPAPLASVVVDCADPRALAPFWVQVTGYGVRTQDEGWVAIGPPAGGVSIAFQQVPEPKVGKNRVHLDLLAEDVEAEARRIEALGGRRLWASTDPADVFIVLADPEGNEFCVISRDAPASAAG
jgi:predicted enzyme related to lactoylglutathione lyase